VSLIKLYLQNPKGSLDDILIDENRVIDEQYLKTSYMNNVLKRINQSTCTKLDENTLSYVDNDFLIVEIQKFTKDEISRSLPLLISLNRKEIQGLGLKLAESKIKNALYLLEEIEPKRTYEVEKVINKLLVSSSFSSSFYNRILLKVLQRKTMILLSWVVIGVIFLIVYLLKDLR